MFAWFERQKKREILKLLFQNTRFLRVQTEVYPNDTDAKVWLDEVGSINDDFHKLGEISHTQLRRLLEINKLIRIYFDQHDIMARAQNKKFDDVHLPLMGWKSYYGDYGL